MKIIVLLFCFLLTACAMPVMQNESRVTIESNPPGAILSTQGLREHAPYTWTWPLVPGQRTTDVIRAEWPSGAFATFRINLTPGRTAHYIVRRPSNFPGLSQDVQSAAKAQQQDADRTAGNIAAVLSGFAEGAASTKKSDYPKSVRCVSSKDGLGQVVTNCDQ